MWALQLTCIKLVQNQVGPLFTVWGPMTLATIMLYPLIRLEPREEGEQRQEKRRWLTYLALAGFGVVPGQVLMTWRTRSSLASDAAILNLTLPILTAFFRFPLPRRTDDRRAMDQFLHRNCWSTPLFRH
jgi:drug/metabolite transporter (DMT)-like permease